MPINQESFNNNLYDLLKTRGLNPIPMDSKGQNLPVPQEADVFKIQFEDGDAWVTIDDAQQLTIYYNDELLEADQSEEFSNLLKHLKNWAQRRQLGFELVNRDHLASDMAKREHMKKKAQLGEGYHPMGKKASYSDNIPAVKIILQHTRPIEEGEQRYRNIAKIFVENVNGERFLLPTNRPGIARVYARHVAEGGTPYDDRGLHITSLVEEYTKMAGFVRATRNGQFNESAQRLVTEGINHYMSLRETLSRMISHRGYNKYFESYTPVLNEENDDATTLNELFVQETLDPRIENVLPILKKLSKNLNEMNELKELEEWSKSITETEDIEESTYTEKKVTVKPVVHDKDGEIGYYREDEKEFFSTHPKYKAGNLPMGAKIDHGSPYEKSVKQWSGASGAHNEGKIEEGSNITYYYIKVDGKPKFKSRNKVTAEKYLKDMMNDINFKNKKVELEVKDEFQGSMEENVDFNDPNVRAHYDKPTAARIKSGETEPVDRTDYNTPPAMRDPMQGKPGFEKRKAALQKMNPIEEAPGAETLAHNDRTEEERLKALDLDEGFSPSSEVADQIIDSIGGEKQLTMNDVYRAVEEYQTMMDNPHKLDVDEVVQLVVDRMNINDLEEDLDANQKRAGQLGPTEPVGKNEKNLRGKLVGASESVEMERLKTLSGIK